MTDTDWVVYSKSLKKQVFRGSRNDSVDYAKKHQKEIGEDKKKTLFVRHDPIMNLELALKKLRQLGGQIVHRKHFFRHEYDTFKKNNCVCHDAINLIYIPPENLTSCRLKTNIYKGDHDKNC
jgi:hypothetical protein